jgi:hypothetical protein
MLFIQYLTITTIDSRSFLNMTSLSVIRYVRGMSRCLGIAFETPGIQDMRLRAKCIENTCPEYDREQLIDVGRLEALLDPTGRYVTCQSCHSPMKILVPGSQREQPSDR